MVTRKNNKLLFVYNADGTFKATVTDFVTRLVAPDKYSCKLCMVTYGPVSEKQPWREFLDSLPNEKEFLHRDEFLKQYPEYKNTKLPVIFIDSGGRFEVFVSAEEINRVENLEGLKKLIITKLDSE